MFLYDDIWFACFFVEQLFLQPCISHNMFFITGMVRQPEYKLMPFSGEEQIPGMTNRVTK